MKALPPALLPPALLPAALLPLLLAFNGGYVDTAGFLALQGLFTAHVTGNFVTLAAALLNGTTGAIAKLLALPVFCVVVLLIRLFGHLIAGRRVPALRVLFGVKLLLLIAGAVFAIRFGPFPNSDSGPAILTGLTLVAAMAVQNATQRVHLASIPPSTLMTGNTTQAVLDATDLIFGQAGPQAAATRARLIRMATTIAAFAAGCAAAALLTLAVGKWCFALPPVAGLLAILVRLEKPATA